MSIGANEFFLSPFCGTELAVAGGAGPADSDWTASLCGLGPQAPACPVASPHFVRNSRNRTVRHDALSNMRCSCSPLPASAWPWRGRNGDSNRKLPRALAKT